jgi:multicomponent Na+:H+ antiporter subunit D
MTVCQTHFKRLLAYSTIAHVGLFTFAAGLLTPSGTAGALLYVVGHACVKGALFLIAGTLLNRYGTLDEVELHGRCRDLRWTPWLAVAGGFALAGMPPFATALGKSVAEEAGSSGGLPWAPALFVAVSALTGGAVLRAAGRVYFGLGPPPQRDTSQVEGESAEQEAPGAGAIRISIVSPIVALLLAALAIGVAPGAHTTFERAADWFTRPEGYTGAALDGATQGVPTQFVSNWTTSGIFLGLASAALAALVALVACYLPRLGPVRRFGLVGRSGLGLLRRLHSGHVGDYVAWMVAGLAALAVLVGPPRH